MSDKIYHFDTFLVQNGLPISDADWYKAISVRLNLLASGLNHDPLFKLGSFPAFPAIERATPVKLRKFRVKDLVRRGQGQLQGRALPYGGRDECRISLSTKGIFTWIRGSVEPHAPGGFPAYRVRGLLFGFVHSGELTLLRLDATISQDCELEGAVYLLEELDSSPQAVSQKLGVHPYQIWRELGRMVYGLFEYRERVILDLKRTKDAVSEENQNAEFLMSIKQIDRLVWSGLESKE